MDVETLIESGIRDPPTQITGCVDIRDMSEVLASQDLLDPVRMFKTPEQWYEQGSRFVSHADGVSEDDGWILSYVFVESQLLANGGCWQVPRASCGSLMRRR